jgi:hypothetical protein
MAPRSMRLVSYCGSRDSNFTRSRQSLSLNDVDKGSPCLPWTIDIPAVALSGMANVGGGYDTNLPNRDALLGCLVVNP